MFQIQDYKTADGRDPFQYWLSRLKDRRAQTAILRRLFRCTEGNFGDHKYCNDGVWELRIAFGPGYRVYYAIQEQEIVLLLMGGDKSTQQADIKRAVQNLEDWKGREDERS